VFAAGLFTDSAICYATAPPAEPGESFGIWDELRKGTEHELGWLGKPLGPPLRLATKQADVLAGVDLASKLTAEGATVYVERGRVMLTPTEPDGGHAPMKLTLREVPGDGPDLFVTMTVKGEPMSDYPPTIGRLINAAVGQQQYQGWLGPELFENGYYFKGLDGEPVDVTFTIEGRAAVMITKLAAYAAPDVIVRAYEHGLVVANPAPHPVTIDLADLRPGDKYRRLNGSSKQDPRTNDGAPVTGPLQLAGKDALFLVRE
jgi:hypothetical protein